MCLAQGHIMVKPVGLEPRMVGTFLVRSLTLYHYATALPIKKYSNLIYYNVTFRSVAVQVHCIINARFLLKLLLQI